MMANHQKTDSITHKEPGFFYDLIVTLLVAFTVTIGVRTFLFEPFSIPSGSMIPTLQVGDYIVTSKYPYGYSRFSLPFVTLPLFNGRVLDFQMPRRGDVVVFKLPLDNKTDYIKRIVGLPGDRIQMRGGELWINEQKVSRTKIDTVAYTDSRGNIVRANRFAETIMGGGKYMVDSLDDTPNLRDTTTFTVPAGHYFMMGDNRDNSTDSRIPSSEGGVGYVPLENIVGRAEFTFFSINNASWWQFWKWLEAVRWSRIFSAVS